MTALRIFRTSAPSLIGAPVLPMDPAEQAVLDELRRRRAASSPSEARPTHSSAVEASAERGNGK